MDKWRWSVFNGETTNENLNDEWWKLREELQGLKPPVDRSESDFDPGAKYHIPANVEYIRYGTRWVVFAFCCCRCEQRIVKYCVIDFKRLWYFAVSHFLTRACVSKLLEWISYCVLISEKTRQQKGRQVLKLVAPVDSQATGMIAMRKRTQSTESRNWAWC